jgi:eukaryotic-like serine/threonine-protein kinase
MKDFFQFLKSKKFILNFLASLAVIIMLLGFVYKWLDSYTDHGNSVTVPDLRGMTIAQAETFLKTKNLSFKISDSSAFIADKPHGTIVEQDPRSDEKVKQGRTIYLSITRSIAPLVKLPSLKDVSLRQAEAILDAYGLKAGEHIFKPDLAKNAVLGLMMNGKTITEEDEIPKGSVIDLIVGDGLGNTQVSVPELTGLTFEEALFVLKGSSLNIGSVFYDGVVSDTLLARVTKQIPEPGDSAFMNQGEAIDIYLRQ